MNFLGGARGSKRLISQNPLLKIVSKKYGLMLRTVENKIEIINLSLFVGKKLEFSKIFVILTESTHFRVSDCTTTINQNVTYIQNTGYPSSYTITSKTCSYTVSGSIGKTF